MAVVRVGRARSIGLVVAWLVGVATGAAGVIDRGVGPVADQLACGIWIHPVDAPVVDGFRLPRGPYGPGNRGLEYGTTAGDQVVAVADGVVRFAGSVAGSHFVVITHGNGVRSTAGFVAAELVSVEDEVVQGQPIAVAMPGFHLTARIGDRYIDPTPLLVDGCFHVALVPVPSGAEAVLQPVVPRGRGDGT